MCAALFGLIAVCSTIALLAVGLPAAARARREAAQQKLAALQEEVQVAVRRRGHPLDALKRSERAGDLPARWRAAPSRSRRASSKATGVPRSPSVAIRRIVERDGGRQMLVECIERRQAGARRAREGDREREGSFVVRFEGLSAVAFGGTPRACAIVRRVHTEAAVDQVPAFTLSRNHS